MRTELWQRNLAALWSGQLLNMVAWSFIYPFIPLYVQTMGVQGVTAAAQWAGVIGAGASLSMAIAQPIWGNLADRWGRKPMVVRSMLGNGMITLLMGIARSPEQLLALRLIQGAVTGTISATTALVATSTPKHRLGFSLGLMQVAAFVGASVGPLLGGIFSDAFGYRTAFYAAGLLMFAGVPVVMGLVHEDHTPPATPTPILGIWAESRSLLAISVFPILVVVIFLVQTGNNIVLPTLSLFVAELSGGENPATAAGLILGTTGAVSAVAALAIGRLADRIGHARILLVCLLGAAVSSFPQALVHQVWELLLLRMLLGIFLGGLMPTTHALVAVTIPNERQGAAFGLAATSSALAFAVGPLSGAGVATQWGMRAVFLATGAVFVVTFVWVSLGFRKHELLKSRPEVGIARGEVSPPGIEGS